jgi:hypothetical protein
MFHLRARMARLAYQTFRVKQFLLSPGFHFFGGLVLTTSLWFTVRRNWSSIQGVLGLLRHWTWSLAVRVRAGVILSNFSSI